MIAVVTSCRYLHPEIGYIKVKVCSNSRHIRARWVGPELLVTIPPDLSTEDYDRFIDGYKEELIARKPKPRYVPGMTIDAPLVDVTLCVGATPPTSDVNILMAGERATRGKRENYTVNISRRAYEVGIDDRRVQEMINKAVIACAVHATRTYLVPRAREIAARIGRAPLGWDVKDFRTKLGCCSSKGIITLSPRLIFLPEELSDYVICHEIAHLSEMNHSAAFHCLCNEYCSGREAEYSRRLKGFTFPVF